MKLFFHINYKTEFGQVLKIVGNHVKLGKNDLSKAPYMFHEGSGNWTLMITTAKITKPFTYRYVVVDEQNGLHQSELGHPDRFSPWIEKRSKIDIFDQWRPPFRGAGVAIPVSSIRTKTGLGVGEFSDLKPLVDWAKTCGLKLIQVLPVNDTTANFSWLDSFPYAAISAFALHPLYLNIDGLGLKTLSKNERTEFRKLRKSLNALPQVDYEAVMKAKWKYIRKFYALTAKQTFNTQDYQDFFKKNADWLRPYAVFCALRDRFKTCDFSQWEKYSTYSEKLVANYIGRSYKSVAIHFFVQYHLHAQLSEAFEYATKKGIQLKGDIPIGVHRYSADTWTNPKLFNMDCQAGAPPDAFSTVGQTWGFPTYNWNEMAKDNYDWWHRRLKKMEDYFHVFRIDHILGFFRIWQIPLNAKDALLGRFSPALPFSIEELNHRGMRFDYERLCKPYVKKNINEVLFIEDAVQKKHFHPRIAFHSTQSYQDMDEHVKHTLNEIYNDYFYHRHNDFWRGIGLEKLRSLKAATNMTVCGEDLGMVPDCVPDVMNELQILSLIIQRMPNDPNVKFAQLSHTPYLSVCSPSSHDISGIRGWWEEAENSTREFFCHELGQQSWCPQVCEPWIAQLIIKQHLHSPSLWAIFPIQDLMAMNEILRLVNHRAERINEPGNNRHYWRYRFHHTVEDLMEFDELNMKIVGLIQLSKRN
ncbi:MAG: 4-alpha-glucanotransferase [Bacteroidales bacterium]|jgi:4-alpha-glucanotransferase|nr:4-alpha-glucanotransferase [Bacteroidales bacterium]